MPSPSPRPCDAVRAVRADRADRAVRVRSAGPAGSFAAALVLAAPILAASAVTAPATAAPEEAEPDLAALLAEAVDLPEAGARAARAEELAELEVPLDAWLGAMAAFEPRAGEALGPGHHTLRADLVVEGRVESTELHLVVPPTTGDAPRGPRPLLVALHGAGGSGAQEVATWSGVAAELGALLLAPTEVADHLGYASTRREAHSVLEAIRWVRRRYDVDENRVWITGFSRGGHLCWDLALRHPGLFAAAAPMAGGPRLTLANGANTLRLIENLDGLPTLAMAGERDDPALIWTLNRIAALCERGEIADGRIEDVEVRLLPNTGHVFDARRREDWVAWFEARVRDPWASRVVRLSAREGESRRAWVEITAFDRDVEETFEPRITVRKGQELSQDEVRERVDELARERTAEVVVERRDDGVVEVEGENAKEIVLRVPPEWIDANGRVTVRAGGTKKPRATPSAEVLLRAFVESFDRTFLPVAEVTVKVR